MAGKTVGTARKHYRLRLDPVSAEFAEARMKESRFKSFGAYVQWLIWKERTGFDGPMAHLEEKLSRTVLNVQEDLEAVLRSTEGANAFLHALAKHLLVNLDELGVEGKRAAQNSAASRYEMLLVQAGKELALRKDMDH